MREPRRVCPECIEPVDPSDANVVLAAKAVDVSGFNPSGMRERGRAVRYYHREHLPPEWAVIPPPSEWTDED